MLTEDLQGHRGVWLTLTQSGRLLGSLARISTDLALRVDQHCHTAATGLEVEGVLARGHRQLLLGPAGSFAPYLGKGWVVREEQCRLGRDSLSWQAARVHRDVVLWGQQSTRRESVHAHREVPHKLLQNKATQVHGLCLRLVEDTDELLSVADRSDLQGAAKQAGQKGRLGKEEGPTHPESPPTTQPSPLFSWCAHGWAALTSTGALHTGGEGLYRTPEQSC